MKKFQGFRKIRTGAFLSAQFAEMADSGLNIPIDDVIRESEWADIPKGVHSKDSSDKIAVLRERRKARKTAAFLDTIEYE